MSQRQRRRSPAELIAAFDRETRRMGSMATLHNHAVAEFNGLHQTDQECLALLHWAGPLTAGDLGAQLGLTSGAVTGLIDRLEAAGWVTRERDDSDRRRVIVRLRKEKQEQVRPIYAPMSTAVAAYRDRLEERDLRTIVQFLEFVNEAFGDATRHARGLRSEALGRREP